MINKNCIAYTMYIRASGFSFGFFLNPHPEPTEQNRVDPRSIWPLKGIFHSQVNMSSPEL